MGKKKGISGALILMLLLLLLSSNFAYAELTPPLPGAPTYIDIGVEKANEMLAENPGQIILLDVRTDGEYDIEYIPGAINIPLSDLENRIDELDKSKTIIVYCKSGSRSGTASETLAQHDFLVYNMLDGINAWKEKFATSIATPMPTETPATTLSPAVTTSTAVSPTLTPIASPSPITSPITPEEEKEIPGFEVPLAITMLLIVFMLLRRKRR
ncbi:MAG: hypothetical protein KAT65_10440 [Methanophagales archaeon]|nr:hypothetical protein [Methanophagales archaeon]